MLDRFNVTKIGQGEVLQAGNAIRLTVPAVDASAYHDAQISSYHTRQGFTYAPPLKMTVRAYYEGDVQGTAGFGFWNHPYAPGSVGIRGLRLPKAVWFFFGSPPHNLAMVRGVPGDGWKAMTFNASNPLFVALAPLAPLGMLLMRIPVLYRWVWPTIGERAIGAGEASLDSALLHEPHTYTLDWREDGVTFSVDGEIVHESQRAPRGKMGFIAWIDNQYAIVTPQGHFGFGVLPVPQPQSLILESITIE